MKTNIKGEKIDIGSNKDNFIHSNLDQLPNNKNNPFDLINTNQ